MEFPASSTNLSNDFRLGVKNAIEFPIFYGISILADNNSRYVNIQIKNTVNTTFNFILTIVIVGIAIFVLFKFLSKSLINEIKTLFLLFVNGEKTWGYIKVVDEKTYIEGSTVYSAGIEFITESGKPIFFKTPFDLMAKPNVGTRIDLIYDPNDPTIARVYSLGTFLVPAFSLLSILLGIGAIVFAIVKLEVLKL